MRLRGECGLRRGHGAHTDTPCRAEQATVHALNRLSARIAAGPRVTPEQMAIVGQAAESTPAGATASGA